MKKTFFFLILTALVFGFTISQAQTTNGTKKGMSYTCTNVSFSDFTYSLSSSINEKVFPYEIEKPEIPYGNELTFNLTKPVGFKEKDGKFQLIISIKVLDKTEKAIMDAQDIYADMNKQGGINAEELKSALSLYVSAANPIRINSEYTLSFVIKDKLGDGEIKGSFKFWTIPLNDSKYEQKDLECSGPIFLTMPGKKIINEFQLNGKKLPVMLAADAKEFYCLFGGMNQWKLENGKATADASIKLTDESGAVIMDSKDLFKQYNDAGGIDPKEIESIPLSVTLGTPMVKGKTYKAEFMVADKRTKGYVKSSFTFVYERKE